MSRTWSARVARRLLAIAVLAPAMLLGGADSAPAQELPAVRLAVGMDLQAQIDANPAGTRYTLEAGVHRLQSLQLQDRDELIGEPGAILSGATELDGWTRNGEVWSSSAEGIDFDGREHGTCQAESPACGFANELFIDGEPVPRAVDRGELQAGEWYLDEAAAQVLLATDPTGRSIEVSVTRRALWGEAQSVLVSGVSIEKYANPAQTGAIDASDGRAWTIRDASIRLTHGAGVQVGVDTVIERSQIIGNGQLGISGAASHVRIADNEIAENNRLGFGIGWASGGIKIVLVDRAEILRNHVHHNSGTGIWIDIDSTEVTIDGNLVEWNLARGIQYEISANAQITSNISRFNGAYDSTWLWGAQILVQNSSDVTVLENVVVVGDDAGDGIAVINQNRGGEPGERLAQRVLVSQNTIRYLGPLGQSGVSDTTDSRGACDASRENRFEGNTYEVSSGDTQHWVWCGGRTWDEFVSLGQELDGLLIAPIEADADGAEALPIAALGAAAAVLVIAAAGALLTTRRLRKRNAAG